MKIILEKQVDGLLILGGEIDKEIVPKEYITALNQLNNAIPVVVMGQKSLSSTVYLLNVI